MEELIQRLAQRYEDSSPIIITVLPAILRFCKNEGVILCKDQFLRLISVLFFRFNLSIICKFCLRVKPCIYYCGLLFDDFIALIMWNCLHVQVAVCVNAKFWDDRCPMSGPPPLPPPLQLAVIFTAPSFPSSLSYHTALAASLFS